MSTTATADGMIVVEDVSTTADRRRQNEETCPIYQLTNDALQHCFGFVGDDQYRNVAGVSQRFQDDYLRSLEIRRPPVFAALQRLHPAVVVPFPAAAVMVWQNSI